MANLQSKPMLGVKVVTEMLAINGTFLQVTTPLQEMVKRVC
jgi:hypothetical protein